MTASGPRPGSAAVRPHISSATATSVPVAQLALPLLRTTAADRPAVAARCALLTRTDPAHARFWVNTPAAATGIPSAVATNERSGSPDALMPQCTPAATKPSAAVTLTLIEPTHG